MESDPTRQWEIIEDYWNDSKSDWVYKLKPTEGEEQIVTVIQRSLRQWQSFHTGDEVKHTRAGHNVIYKVTSTKYDHETGQWLYGMELKSMAGNLPAYKIIRATELTKQLANCESLIAAEGTRPFDDASLL